MEKDKLTREVGPYLVEVGKKGCERCCAGKQWTVVGPDDVAHSESFENPDDAEALAMALNDAFSLGAASERVQVASHPADPLSSLHAENEQL